MIKIQVTLFNPQGHYKPISSLVLVENEEYFKTNKKQIAQDGIIKICQKRYWTQKDLKRFGYKECKVRIYNKDEK